MLEGLDVFSGEKKITFQQFDSYLGRKLKQVCPNGIQNGYHLERVLLNLEDSGRKSDLYAMLTGFSMAIQCSTNERLACLFSLITKNPDVLAEVIRHSKAEEEDKVEETQQDQAKVVADTPADTTPAAATAGDDDESVLNSTISIQEMEQLLNYLLDTYQIPSEKRVMEVKDLKYPFQEYQKATAKDLLHYAIDAQIEAKKITEDKHQQDASFELHEFIDLLKNKQICIWGECYSSGSRKRMKN